MLWFAVRAMIPSPRHDFSHRGGKLFQAAFLEDDRPLLMLMPILADAFEDSAAVAAGRLNKHKYSAKRFHGVIESVWVEWRSSATVPQ